MHHDPDNSSIKSGFSSIACFNQGCKLQLTYNVSRTTAPIDEPHIAPQLRKDITTGELLSHLQEFG